MTTCVFDLDGTLLAGDSTAAWLRMLISSSWLRCGVTAITLPLCLLLVWFSASRRIGASVLLWIDSSSGVVFVMDHQEGDITLIDPAAAKVVARLPIGGELESAVADGHGHLFVNVRDQNKMAVVDTVARKLLRRYDLPGCEGPTASGADLESGILVVACANRTALGLRASDGTIIARLKIDRKADAVMFDTVRKNFYIPCGRDGTLVVISETNEGALAVQSSVATAVGAHTGALDSKTGRLYLPTADFRLTLGGIAPTDGTFRILVLGFEP